MHKFTEKLYQALEKGQDVVLATIVSQSGSTPRTAGARMLILPDNTIIGTIGGGIVEARVIDAAAGVLHTGEPVMKTYDLSQAGQKDSLDVICGGRLSVLLEPIPPTPENIDIYKDRHTRLLQGIECMTISAMGEENGKLKHIERCLCAEGRVIRGRFSFPEPLLGTLTHLAGKERSPHLIELEDRQFLIDPSFVSGTVYIYGAGHVSLQLAILTGMVNFRTVVLDDRAEFANRKRFESAEKIIVLDRFENAMEKDAIGSDAYIVIVTRGHSHDKTVLAQALKTDACYIGMIGSRNKRDTIYRQLKKEGFLQNEIDRVHSPIGIDIAAETPEEIAVSIVAELIRARAEEHRPI